VLGVQAPEDQRLHTQHSPSVEVGAQGDPQTTHLDCRPSLSTWIERRAFSRIS